MIKRSVLLASVSTILVLSCSSFTKGRQEDPHQIPLEDFFRNPVRSSYQISPDGDRLAFFAPYRNRMNIFLKNVSSELKLGRVRRLTSVTDRDLRGFFWKDNETIIYSRDFKGDENFSLFRVDLKKGNVKNLTPFDNVRVGVLDALYEISEDHILITMNKRRRDVFDVYRLNLRNGNLEVIFENPGNITGWLTDHNGELRLAITTDGTKNSILYRDSIEEEFKSILTTDFKNTFYPTFFTFDNKNIYAISNLGRDKACSVKYDLSERKESDILYCHPDVDVSGLHYSRKRQTLLSTTYHTWKLQRKFFDKKIEEIFKTLEKHIPDAEVSITSMDRDEVIYTVVAYSDKNRGVFYIYNSDTGKILSIGKASPWLKPEKLADMKPIKYKSRDGLTIHGYLTLPKDVDHKNLPIVVHPHGGPWVRDTWGFNPLVQFLASRGYAVFQMNFRGSTGYGRAFWEASFRQWGLKMLDDVTDGVNWLIEKGIADPDRIAIYGGSYGGYKVLAGLAFTPEIYACGIDYVGVSNLFTFLETIPPYWEPFLETMYEKIGHPVKDKELFKRTSPVFHVENIKAPLMVFQGAKDPRVNINESDQIVAALRERGVEIEYIVKENEGHGFRNEENRLMMYRKLEKFLKSCLKR